MKNILQKCFSARKALFILASFILIVSSSTASIVTNYYPVANATDLSQVSEWTTDITGATISSPTSFTTANQAFNITNYGGSNGNATLTIDGAWTVSGSGSYIIVGDGTNSVTFTIPATYALTGTLNSIKANSTLIVSTLTGITWPTLADPASTIDFLNLGNSNAIPVLMTYGSVIFDGTKFINTGTNTFIVAGNITLQNSGAGFYPGNTGLTKTSINLTGSNNQTITGNGYVFNCYNFSDTTKTNGTVTFSTNTPISFNNSLWLKQSGTSNLFSDGGNTFTSLNNVNLYGVAAGYSLTGTLVLAGTSGTQKITNNNNSTAPGPAVATLNNVIISTSGTGKVSFITNTTASTVIIKGNLTNNSTGTSPPTVTLNSITPTIGVDTFKIEGNFVNTQTTSVKYNKGTVYSFCGSSPQTLQTAALTDTITNLNINNKAGVTLNSPFSLSGTFSLSNGLLNTSSSTILSLTATGIATTGTSTSYVNGPLMKTGDTAFTFPIGKNGRYAPIAISAPATITNAITAYYTFMACPSGTQALNAPLTNVSSGEFWNLTQTLTDAVNVTLSWENNDSSRISTYDNTLVVADYNGSAWNSEGQSAITATSPGNVTSNSITIPTSGEQITFGSTNISSNPLLTPLTSSTTTNDFNCSGANTGNVTAGVSGGNGAYSYSWNTTPIQTNAIATNLAAGNYALTVMDGNSCSATANVTINSGLSPSANTTITNSCYGQSNGAITAVVTGGTGFYTYSWNTTPIQTNAEATGLLAGTYSVTIMDGNSCSAIVGATLIDPAIVSANVNTTTNPKCNGNSDGTAAVLATGGTGAYTYSWNSTPTQATALAIGLPAGSYTVTVTDVNLCSATTSVVLNNPATLIADSGASLNATCVLTGSASVIVTGGTGSYTYAWSNNATSSSISNLATGTYSVIVTDSNSCTAVASIHLSNPGGVTAAINSGINPTCNASSDGSIAVIAGGGIGSYTYSWNNSSTTSSISALPAGQYSVTVTDGNQCTATANITLQAPPVVTANITSNTNPSCNGSNNGSVGVLAGGGTPSYTYSWNTTPIQTGVSATGLLAGSYTVTVTDANLCPAATATVTLVNPTPVIVSTDTVHSTSCNGCTDGGIRVLVTNGNKNTIVWEDSTGAGYITLSNHISDTATNLTAGTYVCIATDSCGDNSTDTIRIVSPAPTGIQLISSNNGVTVYPLPNNGHFAINLKGEGYRLLAIYNETGEKIYSRNLNENIADNTITMDMSTYSDGIYFAQIITAQGTLNKKIVIQK